MSSLRTHSKTSVRNLVGRTFHDRRCCCYCCCCCFAKNNSTAGVPSGDAVVAPDRCHCFAMIRKIFLYTQKGHCNPNNPKELNPAFAIDRVVAVVVSDSVHVDGCCCYLPRDLSKNDPSLYLWVSRWREVGGCSVAVEVVVGADCCDGAVSHFAPAPPP